MSREEKVFQVILFCFVILIGRLAFIQVYKCKDYSQMAVAQRVRKTPVSLNRGNIFDKNGIAFTSTEIQDGIVNRYEENGLLRHMIGKIDEEHKGESGLEKKFDSLLRGEGSQDTVSLVDSSNNIVQDYGIREYRNKSSNLHTTIDREIQKDIEIIMDEEGMNGAVVVQDTQNGDILAMASRPNYKQDKDQILLDDAADYLNKAVQSYNVGSIFKIITVAAVLENQVWDDTRRFICNEGIQVGDTYVKCVASARHRNVEISLSEAMAYSCNTVMIQLGQEVGAEKIVEMATRFGLGKNQLTLLDGDNSMNPVNEISGQLPKIEDGISNIAIGQGSLLASPIQITNILSIIANDGVEKQSRIITAISDGSGKITKEYEYEEDRVIIEASIAQFIQSMLYDVTLYGSGMQANLADLGGCAGKTGSAEAGNQTHAWFSGYFPYENPKYTISVFVFDGKGGGSVATPIFSKIIRSMEFNK